MSPRSDAAPSSPSTSRTNTPELGPHASPQLQPGNWRVHASIRAKRARRFLLELANLKDEPASVDRFLTGFADFFPSAGFQREKEIEYLAQAGQLKGWRENATREKLGRARWFILSELQGLLRLAWIESDARVIEWKIFELRQHFWLRTTRDFERHFNREDEVPPLTCFEQAMFYFLRNGDLAKVCKNESCPAPYYFAIRRSQKFCTDVCAGPAKRAAKLRWWNENRRFTEH